ncbi:MAG TPA: hypothetical protein V6C72_00740, partial [Chroococcales cyanobacterium]
LVMPTLLSSFLLGDPVHSVNDPNIERAYAYGQYIICRRSSYLALGGHQSVRDEIVEDHAIARVFKERGYKIMVADGRRLYTVRMYTNLESMWLGWTKNLYSLIDSKVINLVMILFLINSSVLLPWIQLLIVGGMWATGNWSPYLNLLTELVLIQLIVHVFWYARNSEHLVGVDWRHFFLFPFGSIAVTVLYVHAAYLVLSGSQVNWKGRRYTVNTHKTIQPSSALDSAALSPDGTD